MTNIAAAPVPFKIEGTEYMMSPLRDVDLTFLDNWVKSKILQAAELSDDPVTRKVAVEVAAVAAWTGKYGTALSRTPEGTARYMHTCIKRRHPHVTLEQVTAWTKVEAHLIEMYRAFNIANDVGEVDRSDPTTANPSTAKVSTSA